MHDLHRRILLLQRRDTLCGDVGPMKVEYLASWRPSHLLQTGISDPRFFQAERNSLGRLPNEASPVSPTCVLLKERKFRLGRPASEASPASLIRVYETSSLSRLRNPARGASPTSLIGVWVRLMDWSVVRPFRGSRLSTPVSSRSSSIRRSPAEMDKARAGDRAVCDPQVFEFRQCREGGQPGVGDPPARHTEERERVQAREVDEVGVGKVEPPEIQVVEPAHPS